MLPGILSGGLSANWRIGSECFRYAVSGFVGLDQRAGSFQWEYRVCFVCVVPLCGRRIDLGIYGIYLPV